MRVNIRKCKVIKPVISLVLLCIIGFCGYKLYEIYDGYAKEKVLHDMVMDYKPEDQTDHTPDQGGDVPDTDSFVNQSILDLQAKYPDVAGWIIVPNTNIDYPFVWYKNNDYYLRRDLDGKHAIAGTIFMDYRCSKDFSDFNTIIYGHHMKNESMFGSIKRFNDKSFFDKNKAGTIFLADKTHTLEVLAYMVLKPADEMIYNTINAEVSKKTAYFDYVKQNARQYRDIAFTGNDKILTLSTCAYEFDDARMVLIGRLADTN